eukprot:Protomagalhaensia_wolfi_Nauph_80__1516@NODE_1921_length_1278_cov_14_554479_g626_i1_p2_GENE_NODE_1921_length_1278_cov_14_554479_g626_i1NODE_1921_length_1278_cov_14_554479_g626_i1_p2_ORF_typecomplete_len185_score1_36DUF677/PF05055_12/0_73_NODE_1921_length_1278_cov_14_554479_g626_i1248802
MPVAIGPDKVIIGILSNPPTSLTPSGNTSWFSPSRFKPSLCSLIFRSHKVCVAKPPSYLTPVTLTLSFTCTNNSACVHKASVAAFLSACFVAMLVWSLAIAILLCATVMASASAGGSKSVPFSFLARRLDNRRNENLRLLAVLFKRFSSASRASSAVTRFISSSVVKFTLGSPLSIHVHDSSLS